MTQPDLSTTPLNNFESSLISSVGNEISIPADAWTSITDDIFFKKDKVYKEGDQVGVGQCVGTVQATPEDVLAWCYDVGSEQDMTKHVKQNGANQVSRKIDTKR